MNNMIILRSVKKFNNNNNNNNNNINNKNNQNVETPNKLPVSFSCSFFATEDSVVKAAVCLL